MKFEQTGFFLANRPEIRFKLVVKQLFNTVVLVKGFTLNWQRRRNPVKVRFLLRFGRQMTDLDSTKQRILLAAGPIFAKKGFRASTVREICDSAQVNLASINYYFGDKQQLYIDTVIHARQMRVQQVPFPKWDSETSPEGKLEDFIALLLNRTVALKTAPWQVRLLMREILQPTEACRKLVEEYFRPFLDALMQIIDEVVGRTLPQHKRLQLAYSIVGQCMYYRFAGDVAAMMIEEYEMEDQFQIEDLVRHITQFSISALTGIRGNACDANSDAESHQDHI